MVSFVVESIRNVHSDECLRTPKSRALLCPSRHLLSFLLVLPPWQGRTHVMVSGCPGPHSIFGPPCICPILASKAPSRPRSSAPTPLQKPRKEKSNKGSFSVTLAPVHAYTRQSPLNKRKLQWLNREARRHRFDSSWKLITEQANRPRSAAACCDDRPPQSLPRARVRQLLRRRRLATYLAGHSSAL